MLAALQHGLLQDGSGGRRRTLPRTTLAYIGSPAGWCEDEAILQANGIPDEFGRPLLPTRFGVQQGPGIGRQQTPFRNASLPLPCSTLRLLDPHHARLRGRSSSEPLKVGGSAGWFGHLPSPAAPAAAVMVAFFVFFDLFTTFLRSWAGARPVNGVGDMIKDVVEGVVKHVDEVRTMVRWFHYFEWNTIMDEDEIGFSTFSSVDDDRRCI
jgi:hypothetical protein